MDDPKLSDDTIVELVCPALLARVTPAPCSGTALAQCVRRLARFARCSRSAFLVAMILLRRAEIAEPCTGPRSERDVQQLFVGALLLAAKTLDDRCYSNAHYARISGALSAGDLVQLEMRLLSLLQFRTFVHPEEYAAIGDQLRVAQHSPVPPAAPVAATAPAPKPAVSATAVTCPKRVRPGDAGRAPVRARAAAAGTVALDEHCSKGQLIGLARTNVRTDGNDVETSRRVCVAIRNSSVDSRSLVSIPSDNVVAWVSVHY